MSLLLLAHVLVFSLILTVPPFCVKQMKRSSHESGTNVRRFWPSSVPTRSAEGLLTLRSQPSGFYWRSKAISASGLEDSRLMKSLIGLVYQFIRCSGCRSSSDRKHAALDVFLLLTKCIKMWRYCNFYSNVFINFWHPQLKLSCRWILRGGVTSRPPVKRKALVFSVRFPIICVTHRLKTLWESERSRLCAEL